MYIIRRAYMNIYIYIHVNIYIYINILARARVHIFMAIIIIYINPETNWPFVRRPAAAVFPGHRSFSFTDRRRRRTSFNSLAGDKSAAVAAKRWTITGVTVVVVRGRVKNRLLSNNKAVARTECTLIRIPTENRPTRPYMGSRVFIENKNNNAHGYRSRFFTSRFFSLQNILLGCIDVTETLVFESRKACIWVKLSCRGDGELSKNLSCGSFECTENTHKIFWYSYFEIFKQLFWANSPDVLERIFYELHNHFNFQKA